MKTWKFRPVEERRAPEGLPAPSPAVPSEKKEEPPSVNEPMGRNLFFLGCVKCLNLAVLLFQGTSFCRDCLDEFKRTGKL